MAHLYIALSGILDHLAWIVGAAVVVTLAEYYWPAGGQPRSLARLENFLIVTLILILWAALNLLIITPVWTVLASHGVFGLVFGNWHPQTVGGWIVATIVYVFVWDFFQYWFHRAEHSFAFLWPLHALHHDDENLNCTTSLRTPIGSLILQFLMVHLPTVMICGSDLLPILSAYLFFRLYGFFNHANIRINMGPLTPVISGPQFHRIHHGCDAEYFNKNFAAFFPLFDILFGTYRRPVANEYPKTGLPDRPQSPLQPMSFLRNVFSLPSNGESKIPTDSAPGKPLRIGASRPA